jgi:hypothetical protein
MKELSPTAQAVFDAAWKGVPSGMRNPYVVRCEQIAASLTALVARESVAFHSQEHGKEFAVPADLIRNIAAELAAEAADVESDQ